jgi:hypothetical protein
MVTPGIRQRLVEPIGCGSTIQRSSEPAMVGTDAVTHYGWLWP